MEGMNEKLVSEFQIRSYVGLGGEVFYKIVIEDHVAGKGKEHVLSSLEEKAIQKDISWLRTLAIDLLTDLYNGSPCDIPLSVGKFTRLFLNGEHHGILDLL